MTSRFAGDGEITGPTCSRASQLLLVQVMHQAHSCVVVHHAHSCAVVHHAHSCVVVYCMDMLHTNMARKCSVDSMADAEMTTLSPYSITDKLIHSTQYHCFDLTNWFSPAQMTVTSLSVRSEYVNAGGS